jgi:PEP-CTERM motif
MRKLLVTAGSAILLALLAAPAARADVVVYPPGATVAGQTLGQWSAEWWQWAYSFPVPINPLFDSNGAQAFRGNVGNAFFLAGAIGQTGNPLNVSVTRTVSIPSGLPIFFPLINAEVDNPSFNPPGTPPPNPPLSVADLQLAAASFLSATDALHATIDGVPVPNLFAHDEKSPVFSYFLPDDNVQNFFGYPFPGGTVIDPAVADGYFLMLANLSPGQHIITFGGNVNQDGNPADDFTLNITYLIDITVPEPSSLALLSLGSLALVGWRRWKGTRLQAKNTSAI